MFLMINAALINWQVMHFLVYCSFNNIDNVNVITALSKQPLSVENDKGYAPNKADQSKA